MITKIIFLVVHVFRFINPILFDFNFVWYENNSLPHQYAARHEVPDSVMTNATKIVVNHRIPVLLRRFDLNFAKKLKTLTMDHCEINDIEAGSFSKIPPLANLSLTGNNIRIVRDGVFNFVDVMILDLSRNKLSTIKYNAFDNMPNLTKIILDYNDLTSYSLGFQECPKLQSISVQFNFIQYLPEDIFKHLTDKNLSVYFSYNKISKIHEDLFQVKEFRDLYLDHNELEDFDLVLGRIDTLNLNVNRITWFSMEFLRKEINKVKTVLAFENPINCTCYKEFVKLRNVVTNKPEGC